MNALTLRVNPNNKKMKNPMGFRPIALCYEPNKETNNELFYEFMESNSAEQQLGVIKVIAESVKDNCNPVVMNFLSLVFYQAEIKHPVKCFLARHITKNEQLQAPFAEELAKEIKKQLGNFIEYPQYIDVVSKIAPCIENFPAGAMAIRAIENDLAEHLINCLKCCTKALSETILSPTEKNEVYNLSHLVLRLILYIVQKINEENAGLLISRFERLRIVIKYLMFDVDSPMDTKSVCGILYLSMGLLENGPDAWICILESTQADEEVRTLLENEAAQLSLCSAIATVVPIDRIQIQTISGESAIVCLTEKIMAIGERSSSESIFILGVTRTLLQISKMLDKVSEPTAGASLMEHLLTFVWGHLEHYMDSVRHLTAQALANVVRYCSGLQSEGDETGLNRLFSALAALDRTRKSYYVSLTSLAAQLGAARMLQRLPSVICDVIDALSVQAVQASATTALEMLLQKHTHESDTRTIYMAWVVPILAHVQTSALDSSVLNILENLMARAVTLDENVFDYILPHIKEFCEPGKEASLKCGLMLLSVARKSGIAGRLYVDHAPSEWKGIIGYDVLERAAVDAEEEIRILSLSLVAESPKTTEAFTEGDLELVLYYLRYNINAQSPNFRQLTLSFMKKFIKRFSESYKALTRNNAPVPHYSSFLERCRALCVASLMPGANYSRRFVALQLLAWTGSMDLNGYKCEWKEEYVEKLLLHLEDSYENNKALALQVLEGAPDDLLQDKKYSVSLDINTIVREASSLKPTDCASAAYKLDFLRRKLPLRVRSQIICTNTDPILYGLLNKLLTELRRQLIVCQKSIVTGARSAPMYGVLHCMGHLMGEVDAEATSDDFSWSILVTDIIATCIAVNEAVACVVNNSSPEGHLPMDAGGVAVTDHGNTGDVVLEDGRPVTAQMVLLCAWRSVKEVSLLLGTIASRLSIEGEGQELGTLSHQQMALIGDHFTRLLAETKHRGAFEQAYVGFTRLLARLWRCRSAPLHAQPAATLRALMSAAERPQRAGNATRRSAGLPFMIQALVTTELQVHGNPRYLHECITTFLRLARTTSLASTNTITTNEGDDISIVSETSILNNKDDDTTRNVISPDSSSTSESQNSTLDSYNLAVESESQNSEWDSVIEARTHSLNILRALFRNSMLEESLAGYVGEGLMVALQGFEGDTWMERNSSTLLFSALMVRIFGVARDRHSEVPAIRNTMTGRIFFLRYPQLYDFILNKLEQATSTLEEHLHPSLYPVLVLLGRLYPSSLEGTASALRLVALVPLVLRCCGSRVRATRALAARAVVPLVSPDQYLPHLASMFSLLQSEAIERNYCHGLLLQLTRLLDRPPRDLVTSSHQIGVQGTSWILAQAAGLKPCFVIADEYVRMLNLMVWRFPSFIDADMLTTIKGYLEEIIFTSRIPPITLGREICLANCLYLYFVIINKTEEDPQHSLVELIYKGLDHKSYEVVLSTLNYLLILYKKLDVKSCRFQKHLSKLSNDNILLKIKESPEYIEKLCKILRNNKYLECVQKTLKLLTLENDTQKYIVGVKVGNENLSNEDIIRHLIDCIQNEHDNLTHIYLESLSNFVSDKLNDLTISEETVLEVLRVIFACSSSESSDSTRHVVAGFLERNFDTLLKLDLKGLDEKQRFEFTSTIWATLVTILEDDEASIRQRASDVIAVTSRGRGHVLPSRAAEMLRDLVETKPDAAAILVLLALLDFRSEVCMTDEISDECRVFDQNERYNIFLEESAWSHACASRLRALCGQQRDPNLLARRIVDDAAYKATFEKLCNNNVVLFRKMFDKKIPIAKNDAINPKIALFINKLRC